MGSLLIFLCAFTAFAISSRGLVGALTENVTLLSFTEDYSRRALRIAKGYKIMAWSFLTLFLFVTAVNTFLDVFFMM